MPVNPQKSFRPRNLLRWRCCSFLFFVSGYGSMIFRVPSIQLFVSSAPPLLSWDLAVFHFISIGVRSTLNLYYSKGVWVLSIRTTSSLLPPTRHSNRWSRVLRFIDHPLNDSQSSIPLVKSQIPPSSHRTLGIHYGAALAGYQRTRDQTRVITTVLLQSELHAARGIVGGGGFRAC